MIFDSVNLNADDLNGYMARMALMHSMQSGYTSFENGLKRILAMIEEPLPRGDDWHAALLSRAEKSIEGSRPAIFSSSFIATADQVRRFRHVATRSYDNFNVAEVSSSIDAATLMAENLMDEFDTFRDAMEAGNPKPSPRPPRG
jgi:hypothetical protein